MELITTKTNLKKLIVLAIFLLGIFRLISFIVHDPVLAYANNFDMSRIQACLNIWPVEEKFIGVKSNLAPLTEYQFLTVAEQECLPSSTLIIDGLVASGLLLLPIKTFSLLPFSIIKALLLVFSIFYFIYLYLNKNNHHAALINALIFSFCLVDPANLLYLSTFYSEFSALLFLVLALNSGYAFLKYKSKTMLTMLCLTLILLGLSKLQHILLPAAIALPLMAYLYFKSKKKEEAFIILASSLLPLVISFLFIWLNEFDHPSTPVNQKHTLSTVLYSESEPFKIEQYFNLSTCTPDRENPYWKFNQDLFQHCNPAKEISHVKVLLQIIKHPDVLFGMVQKSVPRMQSWVTRANLMGHVEGEGGGHVINHLITIDYIFKAVGSVLWAVLLALPIVLVLIQLSIRSYFSTESTVFFYSVTLASYEVFFAALLGDGFFNFQKHIHLWYSLTFVLMLMTFMSVRKIIKEKFNRA